MERKKSSKASPGKKSSSSHDTPRVKPWAELSALSVEEALFHPEHLSGMIATFHVNERPLQGVAGLLDWRFQGAISHFLRSGTLTGQEGECAYLPMTRGNRLYHLILLGAGSSKHPGERKTPSARALSALKANLEALKVERLGLSLSDFGAPPKTEDSDHPLWAELKPVFSHLSLRTVK